MTTVSVPKKSASEFIEKFLEAYLADGFGALPKKEVDILVMSLLMTYADLAHKSNQDLSVLLRATESKIRNLRYEARLKYPPDPEYVKREFLYILSKAQYALDTGKIIFSIEDEYIRHAIQGRLKAKGMYADTSFNRELIIVDTTFLVAVLGEIYDEDMAKDFQDGFDAMESQIDNANFDVVGAFSNFVFEFAKDSFKKYAYDLISGRLGV